MLTALFPDLNQLTMAQAYWKGRLTRHAVFSLFVRRLPDERNYLLACGADTVLEQLENLHFTNDDLEYLASLPRGADHRNVGSQRGAPPDDARGQGWPRRGGGCRPARHRLLHAENARAGDIDHGRARVLHRGCGSDEQRRGRQTLRCPAASRYCDSTDMGSPART